MGVEIGSLSESLEYYRPTPDEYEDHINRIQEVPRGEAVKYSLARTDVTYFAVNQLGMRPYVWQSTFWDSIVKDKSNVIACTARQIGKEQPYSALILTPTGWTTMGEIRKGDIVIGSDGKPTNVVEIFEQGEKDVYELTFTDGSKAECGLDHLWKYKTAGKRPWHVASLKELINKGGNSPVSDRAFRIPLTEPIEMAENKHIISPYVMGCLLGDGGISGDGIKFSTKDREILQRISSELPEGTKITHDSKCDYRIVLKEGRVNPLVQELKRLNLMGTKSNNKFIPKEYLYDSKENRLALLQGLMDTDGSIYGNCIMEFASKSTQLADGVDWLVCSLGGKVVRKKKNIEGYGSFERVFPKIQNINPFWLKRKAERFYNIKYERTRVIKTIRKVRKEQSKCILVDNEDHTYLTNHCIVTHNTAALAIFALWACVHNTMPLEKTTKKTRIIVVSRSDGQSKKIISDVKEWMRIGDDRVRELTKGKIENFFTNKIAKGQNTTNTKGVITFTNGCEIISVPATESARGNTGSILLLDEAAFFDNEEIFEQTLRPIVSQTGNRICMTSTPNGHQGFFFEHFDPENKYQTHQFKRLWVPYTSLYLDNPQYFEEQQRNRDIQLHLGNERMFDQEFMASFNASSVSFFDTEKIDAAIKKDYLFPDESKLPCDLAVDFGAVVSRTVITISALRREKDKEFVQVLKQIEYPPEKDITLIEDISALMHKFNIQRVIFEKCAAAEHMEQFARNKGWNLYMFNPSGEKLKKYLAFKQWLNQGKIHLPNLPELIKQMKGLIQEETPTRTKIYHGAGLLDDRVDSLMMSTYFFTEEHKAQGFIDWDTI